MCVCVCVCVGGGEGYSHILVIQLYMQFGGSHCEPAATVTSLKFTWNEGPDQAI